MRAFADEDGQEFDELAEELIATGRDGVLDQAIRKVGARFGEEAAQDLAQDLWRWPRAPVSALPAGRRWWPCRSRCRPARRPTRSSWAKA
ncbi:hypothetical protein ACFQU7_25655 [Pseudoroseomonas wenyumeiae]